MVMDTERETLWRVVEAIGVRNADKDSDQVEHDIAEAIAALRL
jgi:hypothetical protein